MHGAMSKVERGTRLDGSVDEELGAGARAAVARERARIEELKERVNTRAGAYGSLAVISALIFGFSISISSTVTQSNTGGSGYVATGIIFSNLATSFSMISTTTFTYYYYFSLRLISDRGPHEAQVFFDSESGGLKQVKLVARFGIVTSLVFMIASVAVLGFETLESWLAITNAVILVGALIASSALTLVTMSQYFGIRKGIGLTDRLSRNGIRAAN